MKGKCQCGFTKTLKLLRLQIKLTYHRISFFWKKILFSPQWGSNSRPLVYKTSALTTELWRQMGRQMASPWCHTRVEVSHDWAAQIVRDWKQHKTRKSSCVNARGIPPARGRKILTPPPAGPDPPLAGPDPPGQLDLTPPPAGPDPPASWTWPPPAGPDPPQPAGPDPPLAGPDPPQPAGPDPPGWTWSPPASWTWPPRPAGPDPLPPGWTWPPPPRCDQTENITFPHPSDAGGKKECSSIFGHCTIGTCQWRMRDFPEGDANPKGPPAYCLNNFS